MIEGDYISMGFAPESQWKQRPGFDPAVEELSRRLKISEVLARLLVNRGFEAPEEAEEFLQARLRNLHNPFMFLDMEKAVDRIRKAIETNESILVYGDRDVDGVTSTVLLMQSLQRFGAQRVEWYIPAQDEGYGMNVEAVERAASDGVTLIVTVDCGVTSVDEVALAAERGIDVVVTDHHEPADRLPAAVAIIDPKRPGERYPFPHLAGVGVTLKLCQGLYLAADDAFPYKEDIVAVDFETTGFHPGKILRDDFTEIGAVKLRNLVAVETFHTLVRPRRSIPDDAIELTGITNEMVADAPPPEAVLPSFLDFMGEAAFLAHNTSFDYKFLKTRLKQLKLPAVDYKVYDTLKLSRKHNKNTSHKMGDLCRRYGIDYTDGHRALGDARRCAQLFEILYRVSNRGWKGFLVGALDLVALGTVADMVPLKGENRVLARWGLRVLEKSRRPGLQALLEKARIQDPGTVTGRDVGWGLGPLLNACGRMGEVERGVELLLAPDQDSARRLGEAIDNLNVLRKDRLKTNYEVFEAEMERQADPERDGIVLVAGRDLPHGVTGVVANRLAEKVTRPVVALIIDGDEATGSARSVGSYDIHAALSRCSELFTRFGGHKGAAGVTLPSARIEELRAKLRTVAAETLRPEHLVRSIDYEMELDISRVTMKLLEDIRKLEPYGSDNPEPIFRFSTIKPVKIWTMGAGKEHLKLVFRVNGGTVDAVGWGMGAFNELIVPNATPVDIVATLGINVWKRRRNLQLMMEDIKVPGI